MERTEEQHVLVLLATFNGMRWLPEQLDSILAQEGVSVRIVAADDGSGDGTRDWLLEQSELDGRLTVLPELPPTGSSHANFYRLIALAKPRPGELVAFADQDDRWLPGKLARHARILRERGAAGVSSSVTSFSESGQRRLIRKDYPQREFDYLCESPGPGCTFLITGDLVALAAEVLERDDDAPRVEFHDSLVYAIARGRDLTWVIDGEPTVDYRQHDANVFGSNRGLRAALTRFDLIRHKWHRGQALALAGVASRVATAAQRPALERMVRLLGDRSFRARRELARRASQLRRRPRDQRIIGLLIAFGVW